MSLPLRVGMIALIAAASCEKNEPTKSPPSASASVAPASSSAAPVVAALPHGATACGDLGCLRFEKLDEAFATVLDEQPLILAVGEAHAPKGAAVASSTKRFTDDVLPILAGRTSDLLVELMQPPSGCQKTTTTVKQAQTVVTQKQSENDQNEYVTLGTKAKGVGIVPDLLRPTCDDLANVADSGEPIAQSLALIRRLTVNKVKALVDRDRKSDADVNKIVVSYGGALHNDLSPSPALADYAFGKELAAYVGGKYAEVDFFVPEFVVENDNWKKLEWYEAWKKIDSAGVRGVLMFRPREHGYVIVANRTGS